MVIVFTFICPTGKGLEMLMQDGVRIEASDPSRTGDNLCTTQHLYRVDRRDISFLRFILEAYDGMAVVTTRDAARGIVTVTVAPGCETDVAEILNALVAAGEIYMEPRATGDLNGRGWESVCASST
jgi:hypothetical protein